MSSNNLIVLVVAPDQAMLKSLTFALEAEGYAVIAETCLHPGLLTHESSEIICAIVDEAALVDHRDPFELSGFDVPVIVLVERMSRMPSLPGISLVEKPPLGRDLLDAVAAASGPDGSTYSPVGR